MRLARLALMLSGAMVLLPSVAAAQTPRVGGEFQVNTMTLGEQDEPAAACDAAGNFVLAWEGRTSANDHDFVEGIFFQRYDAFGARLGGETEILPEPACSPPRAFPELCRDDAGNSVLVFRRIPDFDVRGQRFDSSGMLLGTEFQVAEGAQSYFVAYGGHDVACEDGGDFVVAWSANAGFGYYSVNVRAQRFASGGSLIGTEFQVNTYTGAFLPSIAADDDGDFVIAWTDLSGHDGQALGVFARRFNSSGMLAGAEFQVNSYTSGVQIFPSAAIDQDGDFVIAWFDDGYNYPDPGQDGDDSGVFAQLFDSTGVRVGAEFSVNVFTTDDQSFPSAAMDQNGSFVIAWQSGADQDGQGYGIFARRFTSGGASAGSEFQVNAFGTGYQFGPSAARDDGGRFLISWTDTSGRDGDSSGVFARRFDGAGAPVTSDFQVNTFTLGAQGTVFFGPLVNGSDAACNDAGACGVAWNGQPMMAALSPIDVFAQLYDSTGNPSSPEVTLAPALCDRSRDEAEACRNPQTGDFVVVWESIEARYSFYSVDFEIAGQRFDSSGGALGTEFKVSTFTGGEEFYPKVACADDNSFVVVWADDSQRDGDDYGVFARRFDSGGNPVGADFLVNSYTFNDQSYPDVAVDGNEFFVVVWESDNLDGNQEAIFGRRFDSAGNPVAAEFQVNTYTDSEERRPAVAARANGDFLVAWESDHDGDGDGVFARPFASSGFAPFPDFQVNTYTTEDQEQPDVSLATDGSFVITWESFDQDGDDEGVFLRQFAGFSPLGMELQVNTFTVGEQDEVTHCAAADGTSFVVAWEGGPDYYILTATAPGRQAAGGGAGGPLPQPGEAQDGEFSGVFGQLFGSTPTQTPTATATATATLTPTPTPAPMPPVIKSGDDPGSTTVGGMGRPNLPPTCLRVYEIGPNGVPDNGMPDDEFLGQGGTDANGNFSIMLNRPLMDTDVIFVIDVCPPFSPGDPLVGPVALVVAPAPAPVLSRELLLFAVLMLASIALFAIRRAFRPS